jgi:signal transduction histidine kinase/DNA-binding response OmpR family regulator
MEVEGRRLLVVEDSRTQAAALCALLEEHGFQVAVARRGEEALDLSRHRTFDLVISDVLMPGMDGFELCRALKEQALPRPLPVMLLTGQSDPIDIVRGLQAGADNYATKPYDPVLLLERVARVLAEAGQRRPARTASGVEMSFRGEKFVVASDKEQILDLLTSSLEDLARTRVREEEARAAAEAAAHRFRFLSEAGAQLLGSLDPDESLHTVARAFVPAIADLALVFLEDEGGRLRFHFGESAGKESPPEAVLPPQAELPRPPLAGLFLSDDPAAVAAACGPAVTAALAARHVRSVILVRFAGRSERGGALLLADGRWGGRRLDDADLPLALDLGRRLALALESARLYKEAREATRARDELLGIIAHDLRNPLNNVGMAAAVLRESLADHGLGPELNRYVDVINKAARRADALIGDLLDVTRIDAGRLEVETTPEDPRALLADAVEEMGPQATAKSIALVRHVEEPLPATVPADRGRILQVFANLVGNALKFTPAPGTVTLSAAAGPGEIVFSVSDTGPGLPEEHLAHVFDRFWQARQTARLGTGLGLAIAKGIVEAHGGTITVESTPGQGATFRFRLPLAPANAASGGS